MKDYDFDRFFERTYHKHNCNCFDLVADFYKYNLQVDLRKALPAFSQPHSKHGDRSKFKRIRIPQNLCLAVFKPYNTKIEVPHVGIYWQTEVFHIDEGGVRFSPMELMRLNFASVRYYEYVR